MSAPASPFRRSPSTWPTSKRPSSTASSCSRAGRKEKESEEETGDEYQAFRANLIVNNAELKQAPVVIETNPTYVNLFGSIESSMNRMGAVQTDFTRIKAGSFLKANGGFLVVNALDALVEPGVWATLKRTLRNQVFEIQNFASLFLFAASRLKPQAIKPNVKVVMIGDEEIYNILYFADQDFKKIFKIKAEFDNVMPKIRQRHPGLRPLRPEDLRGGFPPPLRPERIGSSSNTGPASPASSASSRPGSTSSPMSSARPATGPRRTGRRSSRPSTSSGRSASGSSGSALIESKIQEMIDDGSILIDTQGAVVGQVNGLSVYDMGQFAFGKPTRITARTSVGRAGVINIEREADLSGRTHNKGVLILGGYLRGMYAQDKPLSFSASIAFEQSYGGVDGDSASSTEVYAILSSLSRLPLRQDIAVTGSLNQKGEIQPIGGVNEKIEGFFDVCRAKG